MDKNIKFVLLKIRSTDSLAIRILHRLLEQEGHSVKSIFAYDSFFQPALSSSAINQVIEHIVAEKPDIVGISLTSYEYGEAVEISRRIRNAAPDILLVWGGIHPTIAPECCVNHCDFACIGEGENTILEIARLLKKQMPRDDLRKVQNLAFTNNGRFFSNPLRPLVTDLDAIPFPDFSHKNKIYIHGQPPALHFTPRYKRDEIYEIMTSRGCHGHCSFCCSPYVRNLYKGSPYSRRRSVVSAIEELIQARSTRPTMKFVVFHDDIFMTDFGWISEFAHEYRKKVGLPFRCNGHVNHINEDVLKILHDAGLEEMSVGIQSGSERVRRDVFRRNTSDSNIMLAAKILKQFKIRVLYDLICSPFETWDDKQNAFRLFSRIPKPFMFSVHEIAFYFNAPITRYALQRKMINEADCIGDLQGRTQGVFNPRIYYGNNLIGNDPHYRLLPAFGIRCLPNSIVRLMVHANGRIVKALIFAACVSRYFLTAIRSRWGQIKKRSRRCQIPTKSG